MSSAPSSRQQSAQPASVLRHHRIADYKQAAGVFAGNASVSLVDLGDGIGCFELHSKMNAISDELSGFVLAQLHVDSPAFAHFDGFVIATDALNFSVGANLALLLQAIGERQWPAIQRSIEQFQVMALAIKYAARPVVAAPAGLSLGGGAEVCLHASACQADTQLTMGLVETAVGLIPAGGGSKEMLLRAVAAVEQGQLGSNGKPLDMTRSLRSAFETIAMAKVARTFSDAQTLRLLNEADGCSTDRFSLLEDAKRRAIDLVQSGYRPPERCQALAAPGSTALAAFSAGMTQLREANLLSDHDVKIASHLARILSGGEVLPGTLVSEQDLLDLEVQAFLSLCGEPKTIQRIEAMLQTGKAFRN